MSILSESQTGIWLNTPVKFLNIQCENELRFAQNDSNWRFLSNDTNQINDLAVAGGVHLHQNTSRSIYAHVKFKVVTEIVRNYHFKRQSMEPSFKLTALDIGCSLQVLGRHLKNSIQDFRYIGLDSSPSINPDILCDVSSTAVSQAFKSMRPDIVLAIDLLPTLHSTEAELSATLSRWLNAMEEQPELFVFTIPECYASDDHLLRLKNEHWLELLNELFVVEDIQAIGFLSALPYWMGKGSQIKPTGLLQRSLNILKDPLYDSHLLQTVESMLTRVLRRTKMLRQFSHSTVVTARVRNVS